MPFTPCRYCIKVATFVILSCCLWQVTQACGWTWWDAPFTIDCGSRGAITYVESYHDNHREDRRWRWCCNFHIAPTNMHCYWTGYVNNWDQLLHFECRANYMISGVSSYHDNRREDRRWRFKCCKDPNLKRYISARRWTGYVNGWDGHLRFHVSGANIITGAISVHDNRRE